MIKLNTFKEVMDEITYDWDSHYTLSKGTSTEGTYYYVNKLTIEPNRMTYKTEEYELADGLFEKVEALYELLHDDCKGL